jgi:hypothetical protein
VKNQFKVADTIGNYLDAYYYLTHCLKKSIRGSIGQNEFGQLYGNRTQCELEQQKRLQGAELLTISAFEDWKYRFQV